MCTRAGQRTTLGSRFRGSNSGRQNWRQAPVPAQPPRRSLKQLLIGFPSCVHFRARGSPARRQRAGPGTAGEGGARAARPLHGPADAAGRSVIRARARGSGRPSFLRARRAAWRGETGLLDLCTGCAGNKSRARAGGRAGAALSDR